MTTLAHVHSGRVLNDDATIAKESADLLADLIRNECVNDGTPESGFESRSTDVLAQYLGDTGLDLERYDRAARARKPGRAASRAATRRRRRCC